MASINSTATLVSQQQSVNYTGMRIRFQKSTDNGATWVDVQSNVRALGTVSDSYTIPANTAGMFRAGYALTDGTNFSPEVLSNTINVSVLATPTAVSINLVLP
jgi:hypothetical protein